MKYLLDTNACIALINGTPVQVRSHFEKAVDIGDLLLVSSVAIFELWYGVSKSKRTAFNTKRLTDFLLGPIRELPFGGEESQTAGRLRAELEVVGKPIGPYDLLIAAQALHHSLTLVTTNVREFGRIKDLVVENWTRH